MPVRICLYTERLDPPFDEGYKKFAYNLFRSAPEGHEALRLSAGDPSVIDVQIEPSRLLRNYELKKAIRKFSPSAVVYLPTASATPASFVRSRVLKSYAYGAPLAMIGLQPRSYSAFSKPFLRLMTPEAVYVQSKLTAESLLAIGIRARIIQGGVDTDRFKPVGSTEKAALRNKYGIDSSTFVALHVGHIKEERNVRLLADAQSLDGVQAVLVGSSSTTQDRDLAGSLSNKGAIILDGYVENIEEVYQLADVYVFPVTERTAAIEMPLSVLEAMACNLPVIMTKFGGLVDCFTEGDGIYFLDEPRRFTQVLSIVRNNPGARTIEKVRQFSWSSVMNRLLAEIEELASR